MRSRLLSTLGTACFCLLALCSADEIQDFKIVFQRIEDGRVNYYEKRVRGIERTNNSLNRSALRSENQADYPLPQSGCGPTALLNILIWYEKYGLIEGKNRDPDAQRYKQALFRTIDAQIIKASGSIRTPEIGVNSAQVGIALDQLVQAGSNNKLRIHTHHLAPPIDTKDILHVTKQFRAGYMVVEPNYITPPEDSISAHAVTILRADIMGNITLGTWGEIYRGRLKMRGKEQWFIPNKPDQLELKITSLIQFIPFKPVEAGANH